MSPPALDSEGLFAATLAIGERLELTMQRAVSFEWQGSVRQLVVFASGPDAVAGEALVAVAAAGAAMPIVLIDDGVVPGFVDATTACVAVGTRRVEPGLAATLAAAAGRGGRLVAIGQAGAFAAADAVDPAVLELAPDTRDARDGFGELVALLFGVAAACGAFAGAPAELTAAVAQARTRRVELEAGPEAAVELARSIGRSFPLAVGCAGVGAVAAARFASAVQLSAKLPAFSAVHPGAGRALASGFGQAGDVTRQLLTLVDLRSDFDPPAAAAVADAFVEVVGETMAAVLQLRAEGDSALAQLVDLVIVGDAAALYLAAAEGIDPGPTPAIEAVTDVADAAR